MHKSTSILSRKIHATLYLQFKQSKLAGIMFFKNDIVDDGPGFEGGDDP
ncbi:hypothetical protein [Desulfonatronum parangueonense]